MNVATGKSRSAEGFPWVGEHLSRRAAAWVSLSTRALAWSIRGRSRVAGCGVRSGWWR